ncbi:MAG: DUF4157 domain-containing protein [Ardenticatenaceae bacterium]|nr:DUF4157 domain-containing protein [Ardenticatenaceae bacterium]
MLTFQHDEEKNAVSAAQAVQVELTTQSESVISDSSLMQKVSALHGRYGNRAVQRMLNGRHTQKSPLPPKLKTGIETLSNLPMDDVTVHYNSDKPAQIGALAFAQGTNIHLAPGQEKHLPHEAWHIVQQMQGRVRPTLLTKGLSINDNPVLEQEADLMGIKAATKQNLDPISPSITGINTATSAETAQLKAEVKITEKGLELGREHDLKRYLELSYATAEKGATEKEMKKQNTYRHMDSQATRREAMVGMMRYYLEDNPVVESAQQLCTELQPQIDEWEEVIESAGGQFLGNADRNTAISNEYDSLVLELMILNRPVTDEAISHDLMMNIRNTAFKVLGDSEENIRLALKHAYSEESTEEKDFLELLPLFTLAIDESIKLTGQKLANSNKAKVHDVEKMCRVAADRLKNLLRNNWLLAMGVFYDTVKGVKKAVYDVALDWQPTEEDDYDEGDYDQEDDAMWSGEDSDL